MTKSKMRKVLCIFLLVIIAAVVFSDERQPFNFYVPVQDEINAFFNLQKYMSSYDTDIRKRADVIQVKQLLDACIKYEILQTYYILEFIKNTKNKSLQEYFIQYCSEQKDLPASFKTSLSVLKERNVSKKGKLLNGKTIEDINYSSFIEIGLFDNQLIAMVLNTNWQNYNIESTTDTPTDKNFTCFICGGGTNSFLMTYRYYDETMESYIQRVEKARFDSGKYDKISLIELPTDGFLKLSNSSKSYIWIASSKDSWSIKNGQIVLNLYSEKYKRSYEVVWFINFSEQNLYYDNPEFIWKYMSEIILLTWID